MLSDVGPAELELAARAMTLKYGFLGLPQGGAKAGVLGDPTRPFEERREQLRKFALAAIDLLRDGRYVPDADMGTEATDIRWMMETVNLGGGPHDWKNNRSGLHTATSVYGSARASLAHLGRSLERCRVAIEGFGHVGSALAELLHGGGATVVAISTAAGAIYNAHGFDVQQLRLHMSEGMPVSSAAGEALPREALLELPVDLLCPCARGGSIHAGNVARVQAAVVCAGANNPMTPEAERALWARGVVVPPDFINNSGGVLGGTLEYAAVSPARAGRLITNAIEGAVGRLLRDAEVAGVLPRALAEPIALARHARVRDAAERPTLPGRLVQVGLEWYRRGWVPESLVGAIAPTYLGRRLQS
jgi:glutamate dehydrogenase/leucine dehydrogenase